MQQRAENIIQTGGVPVNKNFLKRTESHGKEREENRRLY
jgi:hypothetical protein